MADINVTISKFEKVFNEAVAVTENAADETVVDTAQKFIIDPEETANKTVLVIENGDADDMSVKVLAGNQRAYSADETYVAEEGKTMIQVSGAQHSKDGKLEVELTPADGKALLTDHAAKVSFLKLA